MSEISVSNCNQNDIIGRSITVLFDYIKLKHVNIATYGAESIDNGVYVRVLQFGDNHSLQFPSRIECDNDTKKTLLKFLYVHYLISRKWVIQKRFELMDENGNPNDFLNLLNDLNFSIASKWNSITNKTYIPKYYKNVPDDSSVLGDPGGPDEEHNVGDDAVVGDGKEPTVKMTLAR